MDGVRENRRKILITFKRFRTYTQWAARGSLAITTPYLTLKETNNYNCIFRRTHDLIVYSNIIKIGSSNMNFVFFTLNCFSRVPPNNTH